MFSLPTKAPLLAAALAFGFFAASDASANDAESQLLQTVERIERSLDARVGLLIRDTGSDWSISHRADERFLMASTFKSMLCGAVLQQVDIGALDLDERLEITPEDLLDYAPVTDSSVGDTMTVGELCFAALDRSDNTATNLLIDRLGGPEAVTAFLRQIGDQISRLDRREPDVNTFSPGDPRDTTTPTAMVSTLETMLMGDALAPQSRAQLAEWMSKGGVTGALIRASTPTGWLVADRSGSADFNRNIVAMVTPPHRSPYLIAIFLSDADADFETRNAAVIELSETVMDAVINH